MPQLARHAALVHAAGAAGSRWRTYVVAALALGTVIVSATPIVPVDPRYAGLLLAVLAVLLVISLAGLPNPAADTVAADGWSLAPLRRARGWAVIDTLPFEREDVDHVVVSPAGVLAVEARYYPESAAGDEHRLTRELHAAEHAAHKTRLLMRAEGLAELATVTPMLIVWGPGAPALPTGHELRDGVHLVDGARPQRWMHLFAAVRTTGAGRVELCTRLREFADRRASVEERVMPSLRREMWRELKRGVTAERGRRAEQASAHLRRNAS